MPVFTQMQKAFEAIIEDSISITEWLVCGRLGQRGEFLYQGLVNRERLANVAPVCWPVVLIILHCEQDWRTRLLLQERTCYNSGDRPGKLSNLSGRITDRDILASARKNKKAQWSSSPSDTDSVVTAAFSALTGMRTGREMRDEVWQAGATREVREEIGLRITPSRLKYHCCCSPDGKLFFRIYSLKLRNEKDELGEIQKLRPYANLRPFGMKALAELHEAKQCNSLLQLRFDDIFRPIFKQLKIAEE